MVSKKITDKTYFDKDKIKSSNALPVTYIITLITTNSYIISLIDHIFESNAIYQLPYFKIKYIYPLCNCNS